MKSHNKMNPRTTYGVAVVATERGLAHTGARSPPTLVLRRLRAAMEKVQQTLASRRVCAVLRPSTRCLYICSISSDVLSSSTL